MSAHYIDTVHDLARSYNKKELSISKFCEKLNEDADNFAIKFAAWAMNDAYAQSLQTAGIGANDLLLKYKDRPYVDTDNTAGN